MKNWHICIRDLGLEMEAVYAAPTKELAEQMAREDYGIDLDCSPEDVEILYVEEIV